MNTDNQAGVCSANSHNLDVMHLGCCTTCGGNKIVPADRPSPHPSAEAVSGQDNQDDLFTGLQYLHFEKDWSAKKLLNHISENYTLTPKK